ncbi:MAG: hypothetical protein U1F53_09805 [Burkholderiaceae bacterium]
MRTHDAIQRRGWIARWFSLACVVTGGLAAGACTGLMGPPQVSYSEAELNQMLARRFPLEKRVAGMLDVSLSNPRLALKGGAGRLSTEFDLQASDRLLGNAWQGHLSIDYGLRVEHSDHSLRVADPRVASLTLDRGAGQRPSADIERLGALVVEKLLDGVAIHRLKPEQVERLNQAGYELGEVTVSDSGVRVRAVPRH